MSGTYTKSDSVEIKTLTLQSSKGDRTYDLRSQVVSIDVFEDIMFPVIRAEFQCIDAIDLLNSFPIIGEEIITVEFANPGIDLTSSYTFHVKSVENQISNQSAKIKTYTIKAISEEFITNARQFISKKYSSEPTSIIQDVMKSFLKTDKTIAIGDPTKGVQEVLFSRMRPFQAIDMVRKRSVSKDYASSSYVFFENKRGFNFCSIEYLMDQLKDNIKDKIFYYDTTGNSDARNMNTRNILSLMNTSQVNNTKKLTQGSLHNIVKRFDILTGEVVETVYKNTEQQQKFKFASNNAVGLNSTDFEQKHGEKPASSLLVPHSSHMPETYTAESMGAKHSFVSKISQNIYQAHINGDVALTAGDVITINIPTSDGSTGGSPDNRLTSGNYLISKIRHMIHNATSAQKSYRCSLELIKGNYEDRS